MLVAISGSQGSGKTTVINALKNLGYNVVERKTSRSILKEWDKSLSEVNNNFELLIKFQDEIIKRKYEDDMDALFNTAGNNTVVITERTYADSFIYAIFACGKDNEYSEWLDKYHRQCLTYQQSYDYVFYLSGSLTTIQNDGVRGINRHYSKMVDMCMRDYTVSMTHPSRLNILSTKIHEDRVEIIDQQIKSLPKIARNY